MYLSRRRVFWRCSVANHNSQKSHVSHKTPPSMHNQHKNRIFTRRKTTKHNKIYTLHFYNRIYIPVAEKLTFFRYDAGNNSLRHARRVTCRTKRPPPCIISIKTGFHAPRCSWWGHVFCFLRRRAAFGGAVALGLRV